MTFCPSAKSICYFHLEKYISPRIFHEVVCTNTTLFKQIMYNSILFLWNLTVVATFAIKRTLMYKVCNFFPSFSGIESFVLTSKTLNQVMK